MFVIQFDGMAIFLTHIWVFSFTQREEFRFPVPTHGIYSAPSANFLSTLGHRKFPCAITNFYSGPSQISLWQQTRKLDGNWRGNCNRRGWRQRPTDLETKLLQAKLERATNVMLSLYWIKSKNLILSIIIHKKPNFKPFLQHVGCRTDFDFAS